MSASHEWFDWHLTSAGWVAGSYSLDFRGQTEKQIPADRVLTLHNDQYQGHIMSEVDSTWETTWESDDKALIKKLLKQFGKQPK
jgi:hypothetical protein